MSIRENHGRTALRKAAIKRLGDARALLRAGDEHTGGDDMVPSQVTHATGARRKHRP